MGGNPIGDDGMSSVADGLQCNDTLTKLDVQDCEFSVKGTSTWFARFISEMYRILSHFCFSCIESFQKIPQLTQILKTFRFLENCNGFGTKSFYYLLCLRSQNY